MSIRSMFGTDAKTEREGVWLDFGEFQVRAARAGGANKKYQRTLEEIGRPHRRAMQLDLMDNDLAIDILRQVYARSVITGWQTKINDEFVDGIDDGDGSVKPMSEENILAIFRELPDLFDSIQADASSIALYRSSLREEASGN